MTKPITIRNMTRAELDLAIEWAAQEIVLEKIFGVTSFELG